MPDLSGIDFHDEVARVLPEQAERIVFVTGGIPHHATRARVDASERMVIDKPVEPDRLRAVVDEHVERGLRARGIGA
jgi:two-component SAPR family response regulator